MITFTLVSIVLKITKDHVHITELSHFSGFWRRWHHSRAQNWGSSTRRESWKSIISVQQGGAWLLGCQMEEGVIESSLGRERESWSSSVVFFFCKYPVWIQCLNRARWGWKYSPWVNKCQIWAFEFAVPEITVIIIRILKTEALEGFQKIIFLRNSSGALLFIMPYDIKGI